MEAPIRLPNLDHLPPYIEASVADPHAKEPCFEALPASRLRSCAAKNIPSFWFEKSLLKHYKRQLLSLLLFLIITIIVVGTVFGVLLHRKAVKNAGPADSTHRSRLFLRLNVIGEASPYIKVVLPRFCGGQWDGIECCLLCERHYYGATYLLPLPGTTSGYNINEAIMRFPDYNLASNTSSYPLSAIPGLTQTSLIEFMAANSSLAATYLPRNQKLHLFGAGWDDSVSLNGTSKDVNGPLAVANIDREERVVLRFEYEGWKNATSWGPSNVPSFSSIGYLALTPPSTPNQGDTSFTTYFVASNHRPYAWDIDIPGDGPFTQNQTTWSDAMYVIFVFPFASTLPPFSSTVN
ncbi:hypothetical protein BDZ45DRAFT_751381 [Acephala macrosclerotiorum]|nr:hypothetical protein BDZ45DRAFT_751381 [Acephala macrosclerotiorum]